MLTDKKIEHGLCQNLMSGISTDYHIFAIDVTAQKRPYAKKLHDKGFVHKSDPTPGNKSVVIGHNYSSVVYLTQDTHWAPPLSIARVKTTEKETVFGVHQWLEIIKDKDNGFLGKKCIGLFDSSYSSAYAIHEFSKQMKRVDAIFIARLRSNRILMRPMTDTPSSGLGRKASYDKGNPFKLADSNTWGTPHDEVKVIWETKRGNKNTVTIEAWIDLRMRSHHDASITNLPLTVIRVSVTNSEGKKVYKNDLWLVVVGKYLEFFSLSMIWDFYRLRFDIEHFFKFGKQHLLMNSYQTSDYLNEENWMMFVKIAYHQLYHARFLANKIRNPWEKKKEEPFHEIDSDKNLQYTSLSPSYTQRDMVRVLKMMPNITSDVKIRGVSPGREYGFKRPERPDSPIIRKTPKTNQKRVECGIILRFKNNNPIPKPHIKYSGMDKDKIPVELMDIFRKFEEKSSLAIPPPAQI